MTQNTELRRPLAQLCREASEARRLFDAATDPQTKESARWETHRRIQEVKKAEETILRAIDDDNVYVLVLCMMSDIRRAATHGETQADTGWSELLGADGVSPGKEWEDAWILFQSEGFTGSLKNICW